MTINELLALQIPGRKEELNADQRYREWLDYEIGLVIVNQQIDYYYKLYQTGEKYDNNSNSAIAYLLGISDIKPQNRVRTVGGSIPDIDTDFEITRRIDVFEYVKSKYGEAYVSGVATYGTMLSKSAIRNAGRVLGFDLQLVESIADLIPEPFQGKAYSIEESFERSPSLLELYHTNKDAKQIVDIAKRLEGLIQSRGQHAAGVIISSEKLSDVASCFYNDKGQPVIELDKDDAEKVGLVKFDFLGLETLDVIKNTLNLIKKKFNKEIDINNIDYSDPLIYDFIESGNLCGVFQFDTKEMMSYTSKFKPRSLAEISYLTALNRPGPQEHKGSILEARNNNKLTVQNVFPEVDDVLKITNGYCLYQEQVMKIAEVIAGYDGKDNEKLRKIISKKKEDMLLPEMEKFVSRAVKKGFSEEKTLELWDQLKTFGNYGFNAAHAYTYSLLTLQCLFLKTYYYNEFLLSSLETNVDDPERVLFFLDEAANYGIKIVKPDINLSQFNFTIFNNNIYLGFGFISGFSEKACEQLIEDRNKNGDYIGFIDFYLRTNNFLRANHYKNLILLNVFEFTGFNRNTLLQFVENDLPLFEKKEIINSNKDFPYILRLFDELDLLEILNQEYKICGFHLTDNILNLIVPRSGYNYGLIVSVKVVPRKSDKKLMAFMEILTIDNEIVSKTIFAKTFAEVQSKVVTGNIIEYKEKNDFIFELDTAKLSNSYNKPPLSLPSSLAFPFYLRNSSVKVINLPSLTIQILQ